MTHTGNFDFSFAAAVAEADLDAEIAVYKAEQASEAARPDFIHYSLEHNGFVFGDKSAVYQSNTAADAARAPQPTPPPTPDEIDDGDSALCADCGIDICTACNVRWHRGRGLLLARAPQRTPAEIDEADSVVCAAPVSTAVCNGCGRPADERCYECEWPLCAGCKDRHHRHGQPAASRRTGAAFFDGQRAVAAFRKSTIESHLDRARRRAAELHGDLGDAGYSVLVQAEADELFS